MATMTKPRPKRTVEHAALIGDARRHIAQVKRRVTMIMADGEANRSTRAQRAQRMKAEGFDRLDDILAGRE